VRALVIAPRMPEFDREGGSRRIFHLIEFLVEEGWAVSFMAQNASGGEHYARVLRAMGVACYAGPESWRTGDEFVERPEELIAAGKFDLAILAFWYIGETYLPMIRTHSPSTRVVIDTIDLHFLRLSRSAFLTKGDEKPKDPLDARFADEMRREINAYGGADAVLTVSAKEAEIVNDLLGGGGRAHDVPDTDEMPRSSIPWAGRRGLVFVGNFRHIPNIDGVAYLCREVLPLVDPAILVEHPVYIVGNELTPEIAELGRTLLDVRMVGWVPSVAPYLEQARVSLLPLLYGAGTKRKLIQAAMAGTPSVSTSIGTEGLGLRHETEVLVADDPAAFARAIERLVTDEPLWNRLASAGRERVMAVHGRESVRRRFREVLGAVSPSPPATDLGDAG